MKTLLVVVYTIIHPTHAPDVTVYKFDMESAEVCVQAIAEKPDWLFHAGDINVGDYRGVRGSWCETVESAK